MISRGSHQFLYGLVFTIALTAYPAVAQVVEYPSSVRCDSLMLSPVAHAYHAGQKIQVTASGSTSDSKVNNIHVYYARKDADPLENKSWSRVNGNFDAVSGLFQGEIVAPAQAGTYVIAANIDTAKGETCGGNPFYPCCSGGVTVIGGVRKDRECYGCHDEFVVAPNSSFPVSCPQITISPLKRVYGPGEKITVSVKGAVTDGAMEYIRVHFAKADGNLTNNNAWHEFTTGKTVGDTWTGTLNTSEDFTDVVDPRTSMKMNGGEFVIAANIKSTSGKMCSGNPGYDTQSCPVGIAYEPGSGFNNKTPCNGCSQIIAIDPTLYDKFDAKAYWNLAPGNYWHYQGVNKIVNPNESFEARVEMEAPTLICGWLTMPMRFVKSNRAGYWGPKEARGPAHDDAMDRNLRFFITGFLKQNRWSNDYLGVVGWKVYRTSFQGGGDPPWYTLGTFYTKDDPAPRNWDHEFTTHHLEHRYFPPYLFGSVNSGDGWYLHREDAIMGLGKMSDDSKYCKGPHEHEPQLTHDNRGSHGWKIEYAWVERSYPEVGIGNTQTLRAKYVEYGPPLNESWVLREDYYLVKDIGLAQVDVKRFYEGGDPDPNALTIVDPDVTMSLTGFYDGKPMTLTANSSSVEPGGTVQLELPNKYTGRIERELTLSYKTKPEATSVDSWDDKWISKGVISYTVPSDPDLASVKIRLRAPVPKNPSNYEHVMAPTVAVWSNPLELTVSTSSEEDGGIDAQPDISTVPGTDSGSKADGSSGGGATDDGGCGCRQSRQQAEWGWMLMALAGLGVARWRSRKDQ